MAGYDCKASEEGILKLWQDKGIYAEAKRQAKERARAGKTGTKPFYFLDGPPYTSGKVHLGTAWNKTLKDMVLRYKRMTGHDVWDRAGYDMHGLPTEHATQKELKLATKEDIEAYGVDRFIVACRALCLRNMGIMNKDFTRLGVWMDFENAYQSSTKEFMEAEWWLIKQAHEKGRLYEGLRTMTWCPISESALAKHELEYKTVVDDSIFVKFRLEDKKGQKPEREYLIIWTTTPWTIPFNLGVMANPEFEYAKVKVQTGKKGSAEEAGSGEGEEYWYVANALVGAFLGGVLDVQYEIVETVTGAQLEGWRYAHPFQDSLGTHYDAIRQESDKAFTVLLSSEYVDTSGGSGLVHMAPGCGPEDYEVGHVNGIPPFNTLDTKGRFPDSMAEFAGLVAKKDDKQFIAALERRGALIATTKVEHEYPHDWRHHQPVIFRTTKQWFFKVEDLKDDLVRQNDGIRWVPNAAYNAFDSWLKNLRDNSISKQRYWGTPLPVWRNTVEDAAPDDYLVIGSARELKELAGLDEEPEDLHIPTVDSITIKKDGKTYARVPDILDVWVDAGTTSWSCLGYPQEKQDFDALFPADFILEGKDQIRGWFNLLHIASNLAFGKPCFTDVYMHGFINDAQGRKMSKSLGNYILPDEVIAQYGANTLRYYMIGAANPGLDMNYNMDDVGLKHRNLGIYWNLKSLLLGLRNMQGISYKEQKASRLGVEERWLLSRVNSTVKAVTERMDAYLLDEVPGLVEDLLLDLSRNYVQLVRDTLATGTDAEKETVLYAIFTAYHHAMRLFAIVAPMFAEQAYQDLKEAFSLEHESVHLAGWPSWDGKRIDTELEQDFDALFGVVGAALAARDEAQLGVRWPCAELVVETADKEFAERVQRLEESLKQQVNVKKVIYKRFTDAPLTVEPNYKNLGKSFGAETAKMGEFIKKHASKIGGLLAEAGPDGKVSVNGHEFSKDDFTASRRVPDGWRMGTFPRGSVFLKTTLTPVLEAEGFARELIRRVQQLRKEAGLQKSDRILLAIDAPELGSSITAFAGEIQKRTGTQELVLGKADKSYAQTAQTTIKGKAATLALKKV